MRLLLSAVLVLVIGGQAHAQFGGPNKAIPKTQVDADAAKASATAKKTQAQAQTTAGSGTTKAILAIGYGAAADTAYEEVESPSQELIDAMALASYNLKASAYHYTDAVDAIANGDAVFALGVTGMNLGFYDDAVTDFETALGWYNVANTLFNDSNNEADLASWYYQYALFLMGY